MPPAARISDMHVCPMVTPGTPPIPHVGGPITVGCPTVMIGFMPAARVGDMATCVGPPDGKGKRCQAPFLTLGIWHLLIFVGARMLGIAGTERHYRGFCSALSTLNTVSKS